MHPSSARFHALLKELGDLHDSKQGDYGTDADPFANVRASEGFGIPAWLGAVVRLNDKVVRLKAFAKKGTLNNESVEDSLRDIAVYATIALVLYEELSGGLITPRDDFDLDAILARVRQDYTKGAVTPRSTGPAIPTLVSERRGTIQVARGVTNSYSFTGDGRPASPSRGQVQGDATGYAQADAEGR